MNVLKEIANQKGALMFHCLGCNMEHVIYVDESKSKVKWGWNSSMAAPTFTPSYLCTYPWGEERKEVVCHSFITNGQIQYLSDCTHELAGQTVNLPPVNEWPE